MKNFRFLVFAVATLFMTATFQSCEVDLCDEVVCQNDGTCNEGVCDCTTGYEGAFCQTEWRTKALGDFTVNQQCGSATYGPYDYTISVDPDDPLELNYDGMENTTTVHFDFTMTGANTFNVPQQTPCTGCLSHEGTGVINADGTITITYLRSDGVTCTDTLTK